MPTRRQTILTILIPAIVSIIPAIFTYSQSMYEIRQKYRQSHTEAEAGYTTLVTSVKELQVAAKEQHDQIIKLQAYLAAMEQFIARSSGQNQIPRSVVSRPAAARAPQDASGGALARLRPLPAAAPDLTELEPNFNMAAQKKR